jgi:VWFA-related protein
VRYPELALTIVIAVQFWLVAAQQTRPTFRSRVDLVALSVSVVDARQRFVTDLQSRDFEVFENGVRRDVTLFGAAGVPADILLLLDISSSMQSSRAIVAEAAAGFIHTLRPRDRAAVVGFARHVDTLQPFTSDTALLESAVRRPTPTGKTALYDALYIAANEFVRQRQTYQEIRRQALVVFSDGHDTSSLANGDEAINAIHRTGVVVFAISPEARAEHGRLPTRYGRAAAEAAYTLTTLARDSGGRAFFLKGLDRLPDVYADISTEIQNQYTIGFEPDDRRWGNRFRQLVVRVAARADTVVRTRYGYDPAK